MNILKTIAFKLFFNMKTLSLAGQITKTEAADRVRGRGR